MKTRALVGARVVALLLLAAGVAAGFWAFWAGPVRTQKDAAVVFCLSPGERGDLVDAAVALDPAKGDAGERLNVAGRELTPQDWRKEHGSDFKRTCKALFASRSQAAGGGGGAQEAPLTLLSVIVGSGLTLLITWSLGAVDRGRVQADALRSAADAFVSAAETYIRAWTTRAGARPSDQEVRAYRRELIARLGRVSPRWTKAQQLRTELSEGRLGQDLTRDWVGKDRAARESRAGELQADLDGLDRVIGDIAYALEHPGRPHRALRARTADLQT